MRGGCGGEVMHEGKRRRECAGGGTGASIRNHAECSVGEDIRMSKPKTVTEGEQACTRGGGGHHGGGSKRQR